MIVFIHATEYSVEATGARSAPAIKSSEPEEISKVEPMMLSERLPVSRATRSQHLILDVLHERGEVSRSELVTATGLSRSAVAEAVLALTELGLVVEQPTKSGTGRGRPSLRVSLAPSSAYVVGIDLGHSHVTVALAAADGSVRAELTANLDVDASPTNSLDTAARLTMEAIDRVGVAIGDVLAITAGLPGPIQASTHRVAETSVLPRWVGLDLGPELADRIGREVHIANDADLGAVGEHRFGAARDQQDFVYVKASHGVGAGLFLHGATYRGGNGMAGEIGHIPIAGHQSYCRCGGRGCLETVVSIEAVTRQIAAVLTPNSPDGSALPPWDVIRADPAAGRLLSDAGRVIGQVLSSVCQVLNPTAIVLGGHLGALGGEPFRHGVEEAVARYAQPSTAAGLAVRTAALGMRAELIGAVAMSLQQAGSGHLAISQ